jgi:hypothetical protein
MPMPLPTPDARRHLHSRVISFEGFVRDDGLWDMEGRLVDRKSHDYHDHLGNCRHAGEPIHDMSVRLTLTDQRVVTAACASLDVVPYTSCTEVQQGVQALVGARIGEGWKQTVRERLPLVLSCTHLSELLVTMATAVYQTQSMGKDPEHNNPWAAMRELTVAPHFVDKCRSWRLDGEVAQSVFPLLYRAPPPSD